MTNPVLVAQHAFLPLIAFPKKERRFRKSSSDKRPVGTTKIRQLAYPSNRDGYVFAYYAEFLGGRYEAELAARGLEDVVIGYRKGSSNIKRASEAFREIQIRGDCAALALDIKGFFDNISHEVLKRSWNFLLGTELLPADHYNVFKALTTAGKIDRKEILHRLGISSKTRDRDLPSPLCSVVEFRKLRAAKLGFSKLVSKHAETHGIPQGTPLSAMAANISMLDFDTAVHAIVSAIGGSYRRYSDDILILCSPEHVVLLEMSILAALEKYTKTLSLNTSKREETHFGSTSVNSPPYGSMAGKSLQYLGFTFDGAKVRIRSGTLSRYYRSMAYSVRRAKASAWLAQTGKIPGRDTIHKRALLARHTHLGNYSFVGSYARLSACLMGPIGAAAIRRQMASHMRVLQRRLRDEHR